MLPLIEGNDKPIPIPPTKLKVNDLVIFKDRQQNLIFHRLIYINPSQNLFLTKGDNNPKPDHPITKSQIIAKAHNIKRNQKTINIHTIYQTQATLYLQSLYHLVKQLQLQHVPFIFLKGLPVHFYINQHIPFRLFADNDILIQTKDLKQTTKILHRLGFKSHHSKTNTYKSQLNFIKPTKPFPIVIDLHLEPAISFTKIPTLIKLTPTKHITKYLFNHTQTINYQNINLPILSNEALLIYLLLHLFHHNFKGYHRFQLIQDLITKKTINWSKFSQDVTSLGYENIIYPGLKLIQKLYLPDLTIPHISTSFTAKIITFFLCHQPLEKNFIDQTRHQAARQRLFLTFLLAPTPLKFKFKQTLKPTTIKTAIKHY